MQNSRKGSVDSAIFFSQVKVEGAILWVVRLNRAKVSAVSSDLAGVNDVGVVLQVICRRCFLKELESLVESGRLQHCEHQVRLAEVV